MIKIVDVPENFLPKMSVVYPPHQGWNPMIEERAYNFFSTKNDLESDYIYIPIQWTSYHINNDYGQNVQPLKDFCNELIQKHPNEKFFTVVQYDGGTLVGIDNCLIFASSGNFSSPIGNNSKYIPIPLLCDPHEGQSKDVKMNKVGFAGIETHPIRKKMYHYLNGLDGYEFFMNSYDPNRTQKFREILYNSVFALAPRGYGPASYRMYEAIQMKCIPIYISDQFWLPFIDKIKWDGLCLLITEDEIQMIPQKVDLLLESGNYKKFIDYGQEIYQKYLTWDGCLNSIVEHIKN